MRGQVAIEFAAMMGLAILFLMALLVIVAYYTQQVQTAERSSLAEEWVDTLRREILLAARVEDGYQRTIDLPPQLRGTDYEINMTNRSISITAERYTATREIPSVIGAFAIGENTITKEDGVVRIQ